MYKVIPQLQERLKAVPLQMARYLKAVPQAPVVGPTIRAVPLMGPIQQIPQMVTGAIRSYGNTLEDMATPEGRQRLVESAKKVIKEPYEFGNPKLEMLNEPAIEAALNISDFLPGGLFAGGVKVIAKKGIREFAEKGARELAEKGAKELAEKEAKNAIKIVPKPKYKAVATDLVKQEPVINMKRAVPIKDIQGNKAIIPQGEALTPYELKGNKVLLKDGDTYIVNKNQYQNIKGQAVKAEAKPFAPELEGLEETVRGSLTDQQKNRIEEINKITDQMAQDRLPDNRMRNEAEWHNLVAEKENLQNIPNTKYSQYTLPGGENYREVLIKAPTKKTMVAGERLVDEAGNVQPPSFKSSHWDEPNVISHLRLNDRTYKGKKVTFMEELQSDWAREGRDKGFAFNKNKLSAKKVDNTWEVFYEGKRIETNYQAKTAQEAINDAIKSNIEIDKSIPYNENLKNWQELSIKRALKDAVDNGSDYFSWTTGEQQAARYNLSKQVRQINWQTQGNTKIIAIIPNSGDNLIVHTNPEGIVTEGHGGIPNDWIGKRLDQAVGKGVGEKILASNGGDLSGEGLNIGGEWANNLYDRQVKNIVEQLTGQKVEMIKIPIGKENYAVYDFQGNSIGGGYTFQEAKNYIKTHEGTTYKLVSGGNSQNQAIHLTPEVKAKIRGEAPQLKQPSGKSPFVAVPK